MQPFFETLATNIRLPDILDIGVVAFLLYCALRWFRQRASRAIVVGVTLVAMLFLVARWLDMYLTTVLFQSGFTVLLLALIVVFQQDIRRAFDRLAASQVFRRSRQTRPPDEVVDTLVEAVATLAATRTGALLVFEGHEPIEHLVRGGVPVAGCVSLPLLLSIFNPQSPGHDGAVLIDGARITKLGVHLPLSTNLAEIGQRGTRHAAALGLAERCDALILVVSEEQGTISVVQHGKLRQVEPAELTTTLERYYFGRFEPGKQAWYQSVTRDVGLKLAALCMACVLWLLVAYRVDTIQKTIVVPIEYRNLSEDLVIDEPRPTRAELTLSGSERAFDVLDASKLSVTFDLKNVRAEKKYSVRAEDKLKGLPAELTVKQIRPPKVEIFVRRKAPEAA